MSKVDDAPLMLSVSGARGIVGRTMTPAVAAEYAAAFGAYVRATTGASRPTLCIGLDGRPSGQSLSYAATAGLLAAGCDVVRLGVVTTPSVAVMINHHGADGGIVLTASHNPIEWNGLKCLNADGVAPPADQAADIIRRFRERDFAYAPADAPGVATEDDTTHDRHLALIMDAIDPEPIRARGFTVVLDSVNGAGCVAGRRLLEQLGCTVHHLNGEPTGRFAHTPEPIEPNLGELIDATRTHSADVGFAQDPDADRCAIVDDTGRYIGEEYTLVLTAKRVLAMRGGSGDMAANLSTSRMIDDLAAGASNSTVHRAAVGEANVVDAMKPSHAIIGGEGNGGVIFPPVCWVRDSLSSMALVLSLMADENAELSAIVDSLPRYAMIKTKYDLTEVGGLDAVPAMLDAVRHAFPGGRVNDADGVRIDLDDAWVHIRPSNTEPILRLIGEAPTDDAAWAVINQAARAAGLKG